MALPASAVSFFARSLHAASDRAVAADSARIMVRFMGFTPLFVMAAPCGHLIDCYAGTIAGAGLRTPEQRERVPTTIPFDLI
jgi:hypothetical protein